ncbi:MAG TPA: N-acetylmuramic acid 6-phosphate etherase [Candidatus Hydrogenedentes bacterium]|nr:N-acetylmuramic acid 6-phosphate etherase [Candidatus Hydrogenedentota bacterium]
MILAVDGGGTATRAGLYRGGMLLAETTGGPANPVAYGLSRTLETLGELAGRLLPEGEPPEAVFLALAGAAEPSLRDALARETAQRLGTPRVVVTTDLHPLLFANAGRGPGILTIAGTGSSVLGKDVLGGTARAGGRGALFSDDGSAYRLAVEGLRAAAAMADGLGPETPLLELLMAAAGAGSVEELAAWSARAGKREVAALAPVVTAAAEEGDFVAAGCLEEQARRLAGQTTVVARRLGLDDGYRVFMHGGLLLNAPRYAEAFRQCVDMYAEAQFMTCALTGHSAVAAWAETLVRVPEWASEWRGGGSVVSAPELPPTERRADSGPFLDALDAAGMVDLMIRREADTCAAVAACAAEIARVVALAGRVLEGGGRVFYTGAGTSGRLGVLDASECPPTFGVAPDQVIGIIAGGDTALRNSLEGEEDRPEHGSRDLAAHGPGPGDLVVGIAASGATPYVAGALEHARAVGAPTVLVCCVPRPTIPADTVIALDTGPEVLAGSTRLRAGTATKMVLNMISTGGMTLAGYVRRGLMVEMKPTNAKLRRRAARIVAELGGCPVEAAAELLETAGWHIPTAVVMAVLEMSAEEALRRLEAAGGRLRGVLGGF